MGLRDSIRNLFSKSKESQEDFFTKQFEEDDEKARLANNIVKLVGDIKRKNSFDSSIWNLSNVTSYELKNKSLSELQRLNSNLEKRLVELNQIANTNKINDSLEEAKWTGQRPQNMTTYQFDKLQKGDDGR